jgi:hypothetical protein
MTWQFSQGPGPIQPLIVVTPTGFVRSVTEGHDLDNETFTVQNGGGATLNYTVAEQSSWLGVSPSSGVSTGDPVQHTITFSTASLPLGGPYTAAITISDPLASNDPVQMNVSVTVVPVIVPGDFDNDGDVDMDDYGRFQECLSGHGQVQNRPECANARMDTDPDVDQDDLEKFLGCMSAPDVAGDPDCLSS